MASQKPGGRYIFILLAILFAVYLAIVYQDQLSGLVSREEFPVESFEQIKDSYNELIEVKDQVVTLIVSDIDTDEDGLMNPIEFLLGSDISLVDTDEDGVSDYDEFIAETDLTDPQNIISLGPEFIQNRLTLLSAEGYTQGDELAKKYYTKRFLVAHESGDVVTAEQQLIFAYQYQKNEQFFLDLLTAAYQEEENNQALFIANQFVKQEEQNPNAYFHLGFAHQSMGDLNKAEESYRKAIDRGSELPSLYNNLAIILQKQEKDSEAISFYNTAIELDPDNIDYQQNKQLLEEKMSNS